MKYHDFVSQYDEDRFLEPFTECADHGGSQVYMFRQNTQTESRHRTEGLKTTVCMHGMHGRIIVDNMYEFCHSS